MSEELNTQAATETTDTGATPPAEATGAPDKKDDLEALLEQYRKETGSTEQTQTSKPDEKPVALDVLQSKVATLEAEITSQRQRGELAELAQGARAAGGIPDSIDDEMIVGLADGMARKDPALARAWTASANDPKARATLIKKVGEALGSKFAKARGVDEQATADREAVAASVRGSSTKAPEGRAPDYAKLSDNEFRKECEKLGITF